MAILAYREKVNQFLDEIGKGVSDLVIDFVFQLGLLFRFSANGMRLFFKRPYRWEDLIQHMEFVGNKSVFIIVLTGVFTGTTIVDGKA